MIVIIVITIIIMLILLLIILVTANSPSQYSFTRLRIAWKEYFDTDTVSSHTKPLCVSSSRSQHIIIYLDVFYTPLFRNGYLKKKATKQKTP